MRKPLWNPCRAARGICLAIVGLCLAAAQARGAAPIEKALPGSTFALVKVNSAAELREAFSKSHLGQLWGDPALKPVKDDILAKLEDSNNALKNAVGLSIEEVMALPLGPLAFALVGRDDPKLPWAGIVTFDVGPKAQVVADAMNKATKLAEEKGECKVMTENFKDLVLKVIHSTKEEDKDDPPIVWTSQGGLFYVATDSETIKDLITHADGREGSLSDQESFALVKRKVADDSQAFGYLDVGQVLKLLVKSLSSQGGNPQQIEAMFQVSGINGLKALGGSLSYNTGAYDSLTRIFALAPAPTQGLLRLFPMPLANLRPEPWVPASTASYETISWDLDGAYVALNDLANMLKPGLIQDFEAQLAGPNGGEALSFQKDICGPLGDRITIISDYKRKPGGKAEDDTSRTLVGIALENTQGFQTALNKVFALTKPDFKKREFQGTTIYDISIPDLPAAGGANVTLKGPVSLAVAKDTLFLATEPTLLEQVLRGGPKLADSPAFQAVAKEIPEQTSTFSFARPEESARQMYELFKTGQFQKMLEETARAKGQPVPKIGEMIDKDKLPDFSVFSKYLSQSGGYGMMTDDGFSLLSFTLRKDNP
jgi:hypothetical protein